MLTDPDERKAALREAQEENERIRVHDANVVKRALADVREAREENEALRGNLKGNPVLATFDGIAKLKAERDTLTAELQAKDEALQDVVDGEAAIDCVLERLEEGRAKLGGFGEPVWSQAMMAYRHTLRALREAQEENRKLVQNAGVAAEVLDALRAALARKDKALNHILGLGDYWGNEGRGLGEYFRAVEDTARRALTPPTKGQR